MTLAEAALLAGLPAAPSEYSPFGSHPQKAFERQQEVLRRMTEDRYITSDQAKLALAEEIHLTKPHTAIRAPAFCHVRQRNIRKPVWIAARGPGRAPHRHLA